MKKIYVLFCAAVLASSCSQFDCTNTNPVFDSNLPGSEPYKFELARLIELEGADNLEYYVGGYSEIDGVRQLNVNVEGDTICASAVLLITNTTKGIEGIIDTKGVGYAHAGLSGLEFDIVRKNGNTSFIYKGVDRIID